MNIQKRNKSLNALRFEIQKQMFNAENGVHSDSELAWYANDYCVVFGKFDGFTEWVCGQITSISTATAVAKVPLHKSRPSTRSIWNVQDFALETQLAFIEIKLRGGQTS